MLINDVCKLALSSGFFTEERSQYRRPERFEMGQQRRTLRTDRIGVVQDRGDPALFIKRRQGDGQLLTAAEVEIRNIRRLIGSVSQSDLDSG